MDLFQAKATPNPVTLNIYADEVQSKTCPYTGHDWLYIGIIVENLAHELLPDIVELRYRGNYDHTSVYFPKNDKLVHWSEIKGTDTKNICLRWVRYILDPSRSEKSFYAYILGLDNSKLNRHEFGGTQLFNRKYNRFFRAAILYALKCFFPSRRIIIRNIYHEQGQQQNYDYFPWHTIYKIDQEDNNITCECDTISFLPKNHRICQRSNIIQLCDLFLGLATTAIHGLNESKTSKYKAELLDLFLPLFRRMTENPRNINSRYRHYNRIMIRSFPRERTNLDDIRRFSNQFYTNRKLHYLEQISGQISLPL